MTENDQPDVESPQSRQNGSFRKIAEGYRMSLVGHREFFDFLHGTLDELAAKQRDDWKERYRAALDPLTTDEKRDLMLFSFSMPPLREIFERWLAEAEAGAENDEDKLQLTRKYLDAPEDDRPKQISGPTAQAFSEMMEPFRAWPWRGLNAQRERLYCSVLTGIVGQFEVLVAGIAHQFFNHAPGAIGADEKALSLKDLHEIGSVEAAVDLVIEQRVDSLLAGSVEDWANFFEKRMNIDLRDLSGEWPRFVEYVQRRHLIVHTGGVITRRYLANVPPALVKVYFGDDCGPGTTAHLSEEYVRNALDDFETVGMLLALTAWVTISRNRNGRAEHYLTGYLYDNLVYGRWGIARAIAEHGIGSRLLSQSGQIVCQFNYWLCLKRTGEFDSCRTAVEDFDVSALQPRFALVRLALLDDLDGFCDVVDDTNGADLDRQAWDEWPVFEPFRSEERFQELRRKYLTVQVSNEEDLTAGPDEVTGEDEVGEDGSAKAGDPPVAESDSEDAGDCT